MILLIFSLSESCRGTSIGELLIPVCGKFRSVDGNLLKVAIGFSQTLHSIIGMVFLVVVVIQRKEKNWESDRNNDEKEVFHNLKKILYEKR